MSGKSPVGALDVDAVARLDEIFERFEERGMSGFEVGGDGFGRLRDGYKLFAHALGQGAQQVGDFLFEETGHQPVEHLGIDGVQ